MAVRQYVGARYVPKFFNNPNGTAEWIPGIAYEALTIVTYLGNSFTSKVPVNAGVGSPNENPEYWVNTGNYNSQVEQAITEINTLVDDVKNSMQELENNVTANDILLVGDSYLANTVDGVNFGTIFEQNWKIQFPNSTVYKLGANGARLHYVDSSTNCFYRVLNENQTIVPTDKREMVKYVAVVGGYNDRAQTNGTTYDDGARRFINLAKQLYPNAIIVGCNVGMCITGGNADSATYQQMYNSHTLWKNAISLAGGKYISNGYNCLRNSSSFQSDGIHPSANGHRNIARLLFNGILGMNYSMLRLCDESISFNTSNNLANITPAEGVSSSGFTITTIFNENDVSIKINQFAITIANQTTYMFGSIPIGKVVSAGLQATSIHLVMVIPGTLTINGKGYNTNMILDLDEQGNLTAKIPTVDSSGNALSGENAVFTGLGFGGVKNGLMMF